MDRFGTLYNLSEGCIEVCTNKNPGRKSDDAANANLESGIRACSPAAASEAIAWGPAPTSKKVSMMSHPQAARYLRSPDGQRALKGREQQMQAWIAEHSSDVLHALSELIYGKPEDCNGNNARQWVCPLCKLALSKPGELIRHVRSKHKAADSKDVQCWRLYLQPDGCANYDRSTWDKASPRPYSSNTPCKLAIHKPAKQHCLAAAAADINHSKQQPAKRARVTATSRALPGRQAGKSKRNCQHGEKLRQGVTSALVPGSAGAVHQGSPAPNPDMAGTAPAAPAPAPAPTAAPAPGTTIPQPGSTVPQPGSRMPPTAFSDGAEGQAQHAAANQPESFRQLGGSDKLEMVRMALTFAEKIAKM